MSWWRRTARRYAFVAAVLMPVVACSSGSGSAADPGDPADAAPPTEWAACASRTAPTSVVDTYARAQSATLSGGTSRLQCGNAKYGFRHILVRHTEDWQQAAARAGAADWERFTDGVLTQVLAAPDSVDCDRSRNTCAFHGVDPVASVVVVARQDGKVITAYPED